MTSHAIAKPLPSSARRIRLRVRRRYLAVIATLFFMICAGSFAAGWRDSDWAMYPPQATLPWSLANYPVLARASTPLKIHTSTGVTLVGRFIRGTRGATIILSHGCGGNQDELLPEANVLHAAGFNVVTYSERGRGGSTGQITLGSLETKDLRSVVDMVVRHKYVNPNEIGEFGFSMGAGFTILEAANDRRVKAVVDDAGWANAFDWLRPHLRDFWEDPTHMYSPLALWLVEQRTGADLSKLMPEKVIARISPRPILIIQGTRDTHVRLAEGERNYAAARGPKTLWLVNAGHYDTARPGGIATTKRLSAWFLHALVPAHR
jgi:uncharacterized protein